MPRYHIELDCKSIETAVFDDVEATNMDSAIQKALNREVEPTRFKSYPGDDEQPDEECCHEIT